MLAVLHTKSNLGKKFDPFSVLFHSFFRESEENSAADLSGQKEFLAVPFVSAAEISPHSATLVMV
jgi:hypothetical protein